MSMHLNLYWYAATVTSIYDGDSYTLEVDLGFRLSSEIRVRLRGVDTPEVTRRGGKSEEHVAEGKRIRDDLIGLMLGKRVFIRSYKTGKFGRYVADVVVPVDGSVDGGYTDVRSYLLNKYPSVRRMDDKGRIID